MSDGQVLATTADELEAQLRALFGDAIGARTVLGAGPEFEVRSTAIPDVATWLAGEQQLNYLALLSGIDRLTHLEVVWIISRMPEPPGYQQVALRAKLDRAEPRVASCAGIWRAAEWHERECYDLLGVRFRGHPDLRRIVLPEVWEGFPLRKDYVYDNGTMVEEILAAELGSDERERL